MATTLGVPSLSETQNSRTGGEEETGTSGGWLKKRDSEVDADALLARVGELAGKLSRYVQFPEDNGIHLKTTACMNAWYDLEGGIKATIEYVREGIVRQNQSLKQMIKDGKALLEEISFRVRVYDAAMVCHEAVFESSVTLSDLQKYNAHFKLLDKTNELALVLERAPGRFKAARRDLLHAQMTLKEFDASWKEDLTQRLSHRPRWVPDAFVKQCSNCQRWFSVFLTRHHCRACGFIFCDACSVILASLPKLVYFTAQRVCLDCEKGHAPWACRKQTQLQIQLKSIFPDLMY